MNADIITENIQQFNLKWTNYATNLLEALLDKFSRGVLTDVTLCCEGTLIRAHKMILAASSTFFEVIGYRIFNLCNLMFILFSIAVIRYLHRIKLIDYTKRSAS